MSQAGYWIPWAQALPTVRCETIKTPPKSTSAETDLLPGDSGHRSVDKLHPFQGGSEENSRRWRAEDQEETEQRGQGAN